jgi:hypothetical protein
MSQLIRASFACASGLLLSVAACAETTLDPTPGDPIVGLEVPFAVSGHFVPSGYMGDGADAEGIDAETELDACAPRPSGARGDCYRFVYEARDQLWGGVYWQFPQDNWGDWEGRKIAPGATQVAFYAAGGAGGEELTITIGGVRDPLLPHKDDLRVEQPVTLTTEMTRYTVPLSGQQFERVIGGFSWSASFPPETNAALAEPLVIYLDDIVWE